MNSIVSEKRYIQQALGIPYENLSQSYLRAETNLASLSQYAFTLQANKKSSPLVSERLLNLNDQFVITHFRIGLKALTTANINDTLELNTQVQTFLDPAVFLGDTANAGAIYNGSLEFTIDRKQYLPEFPVSSFYRVPTTQTNSPSEGGSAVIVNGYDNGLFGFYPSEPTLIDGRQTLDINLVLGAAVDITDATTTARAVFEVRGYLVVNSKS
jgi:predicted transport protein